MTTKQGVNSNTMYAHRLFGMLDELVSARIPHGHWCLRNGPRGFVVLEIVHIWEGKYVRNQRTFVQDELSTMNAEAWFVEIDEMLTALESKLSEKNNATSN